MKLNTLFGICVLLLFAAVGAGASGSTRKSVRSRRWEGGQRLAEKILASKIKIGELEKRARDLEAALSINSPNHRSKRNLPPTVPEPDPLPEAQCYCPPGPPGRPGDVGPPGVDGPMGPPGLPGLPGRSSSDRPIAPVSRPSPGPRGVSGRPGLDGFPGVPGQRGPPGDTGPPGAPGPMGTCCADRTEEPAATNGNQEEDGQIEDEDEEEENP